MNQYKKIQDMMKRIKEDYPNRFIITASQVNRPHHTIPKFHRSRLGEPNVVVIDYIDLMRS